MSNSVRSYLVDLPLVAILRGLRPENARAIGTALVEAGFRVIEVPLNSPEPFRSIEILANAFRDDVLVGAGTVIDPGDVCRVEAAGGRLVVMPHADVQVIGEARRRGLFCTPGVATPTEAFAALKAGASGLKLFPAEGIPPAVVKAWRAVLPKDAALIPVGGIRPETMRSYVEAGANGFGLGSALFAPHHSLGDVARNAAAFASAWQQIRG